MGKKYIPYIRCSNYEQFSALSIACVWCFIWVNFYYISNSSIGIWFVCFLISIILYYNLIKTKKCLLSIYIIRRFMVRYFFIQAIKKIYKSHFVWIEFSFEWFLWYCTPQHVNVWNKKCIETLDANIPYHYGVYIYLMVVFKSTPPVWLVKSSFHFLSLLL